MTGVSVVAWVTVTYHHPHPDSGTARLSYDVHRPLEIAAQFGPDLWVLGRDAIAAALAGAPPCGGDAKMWADGDVLWLELHGSTDDHHPAAATMTFPAAEVRAVLELTTRLIPYGEEGHLVAEDIDVGLDRLLAGGGDRP